MKLWIIQKFNFKHQFLDRSVQGRRRREAIQPLLLSSPEFNFSAALVNSQLVCLLPVGILNLVMFIWNSFVIVCCPNGEWPIQYTLKHQPMKCRTMNRGQTTTPGTPCPILFDECVGSLTSPADHVTLKMQETGPTVYSSRPRRLKRLTICI